MLHDTNWQTHTNVCHSPLPHSPGAHGKNNFEHIPMLWASRVGWDHNCWFKGLAMPSTLQPHALLSFLLCFRNGSSHWLALNSRPRGEWHGQQLQSLLLCCQWAKSEPVPLNISSSTVQVCSLTSRMSCSPLPLRCKGSALYIHPKFSSKRWLELHETLKAMFWKWNFPVRSGENGHHFWKCRRDQASNHLALGNT